MRGREFLMKDGYNFDLTVEDAIHAYNRHMVSYIRTYERMGLKAIPMKADTGPIGGDHTHEFLVLAPTGESAVFYDRAVTDLTLGDREIDYRRPGPGQPRSSPPGPGPTPAPTSATTRRPSPTMPEERRVEGRGIEVGQIFFFGTKYSEPMKALVVNEAGRAGAGADGLARHRRLAAGRRDHRGEPRREGHRLARRASPRSTSASSTCGRATRPPTPPARRSTPG